MAVKSFKELIAWQKAMQLAIAVYKGSSRFPREEIFGLRQQLRKSAVSVPSNIAEGQCRQTTADFLRFLSIAYGSLGELETQLILARELGFMDDATSKDLVDRASEVGKLINGLSRSLNSGP
jgi:four helix bundle protein